MERCTTQKKLKTEGKASKQNETQVLREISKYLLTPARREKREKKKTEVSTTGCPVDEGGERVNKRERGKHGGNIH